MILQETLIYIFIKELKKTINIIFNYKIKLAFFNRKF